MSFSIAGERYEGAADFHGYVAAARKHAELWNGLYRTLSIDQTLIDRIKSISGRWHLLVLSEHWCADAVSTVPFLARLAEQVPSLDLRILPRDENPDLMDAHLTNGTRSIPVVMVLDDDFVEHGWWGPRPTELQRWFHAEGAALTMEERHKSKRQWYARDRGVSTIREVLALLERATGATTARG